MLKTYFKPHSSSIVVTNAFHSIHVVALQPRLKAGVVCLLWVVAFSSWQGEHRRFFTVWEQSLSAQCKSSWGESWKTHQGSPPPEVLCDTVGEGQLVLSLSSVSLCLKSVKHETERNIVWKRKKNRRLSDEPSVVVVLLTFTPKISCFTGFSWSPSDSRLSSTVLAGTKGGMFNLKKINKKIPNQNSLFCGTTGSFSQNRCT